MTTLCINFEQNRPTFISKSVPVSQAEPLKANFSSHLYNTTPFPLLNIGFPVSRICLVPVQHWKGAGGLPLNLNRIWNRISDMLQLAIDLVNCQLLLSPIELTLPSRLLVHLYFLIDFQWRGLSLLVLTCCFLTSPVDKGQGGNPTGIKNANKKNIKQESR